MSVFALDSARPVPAGGFDPLDRTSIEFQAISQTSHETKRGTARRHEHLNSALWLVASVASPSAFFTSSPADPDLLAISPES